MPELPEVEAARGRLERAAVGHRLTGARTLHPSAARALPATDAAALVGARLDAVERRGKHQILRLDDGRTLHAHFRMNGDWHIGAIDDALPPHARYVLAFARGLRVALVDSRALATLTLHAAGDDPVPSIGPDPTGAAFDGAALRVALAGRRTTIKVALLDQRIVAGVGNIYAAEALWRARIDPRAAAGALGAALCTRLAAGIRAAMAAADAAPGRHAEREAVERLDVYGREGEACRRCGARIRRLVQGGRSTYWCAGCQRAGRPRGKRIGQGTRKLGVTERPKTCD